MSIICLRQWLVFGGGRDPVCSRREGVSQVQANGAALDRAQMAARPGPRPTHDVMENLPSFKGATARPLCSVTSPLPTHVLQHLAMPEEAPIPEEAPRLCAGSNQAT